jgi:16S rRNA (cytosine967-C5)-methyltransferase
MGSVSRKISPYHWDDSLPISPARVTSFEILRRIEKDKSFATELLHSKAPTSLSARDYRLATELVLGVLRNQKLLDWYLSRFSKIILEKLDSEVKVALRLGAYQMLMLSRVPPRAALHESVELVSTSRIKSAKGFVNAVLRRIKRDEFQQALQTLSLESIYGLSVRYSHPEWLVQRWVDCFDPNTLIQILEENNRPPRTFFRLNTATLSRSALWKELTSCGIEFSASSLCEDILELKNGDLNQTALMREHKIAIQDAGSQVIPHLLDPEEADVCLDLCAAPGGKTSQLAQMTSGIARIFAVEAHWHRVRIMKSLHGDNWRNLYFTVADGTRPLPFSIAFDKILIDAPCSGTGTLRRHPEIRWKLLPSDLATLSQLQSALLERAAGYLKPGGLVVYSTCSLEPEENEQVIEAFLAKNPQFQLELPSDERFARFFDLHRYFRLLPTDSDGFFAAMLRKTAGRR